MLTTRRGFFEALAALVGVAATGRVLAARPMTGGVYPTILGDATTGTVRGINRASFTFWRNQNAAWPDVQSPADFDKLREELRQTYHDCSVGGFTHMT